MRPSITYERADFIADYLLSQGIRPGTPIPRLLFDKLLSAAFDASHGTIFHIITAGKHRERWRVSAKAGIYGGPIVLTAMSPPSGPPPPVSTSHHP